MKRLTTRSLAPLGAAVAIVMLLSPAAQSAAPLQQGALAVSPGQSQTITCTTSLTIAPASSQSVTIACAPASGATAMPTPTSTATVPPASTATRTPVATTGPTASPVATAVPPPSGGSVGMWISAAELASRPMSGAAWGRVKAAADGSLGTPKISDQDSKHDTNTLAVALVYARTGDTFYRSKAADAIMAAIGTEQGGRVLALGRNLVSYVIAADLIGLKTYDAGKDAQFRSWLSAVRTSGMTECEHLIACHSRRPNNWGTHAGASRIAADIYLGDKTDLDQAARVYEGWLGNRNRYAGFSYGDLSWQADPSQPVGINPKGAKRDGHSIDGVMPDDQRRGGGYTYPFPCENYSWEGSQGMVVALHLLHRAGYDAWNWSDKAALRSVDWQYNVNNSCAAQGDDTWQIYLINRAYGSNFPVGAANTGKNMGWTDWTHGP